jgi:hypothetical protein
LATLSALSALAGLLLAALMLSAAGLALAALLLLTGLLLAGLLLAALLRIALLLLRVARVLLFVRHRDVLHCFRKPPVQRNNNPGTAIAVPRTFAHIFSNELENNRKIPTFRSSERLQSAPAQTGATGFAARKPPC